MSTSKKPRYNLNLIVQETGLKADTIRAWERRYGLPQPSRTEGGHRLYSEFDLQTLNWLAARQKEGLRISQAADYWHELIDSGEDPLRSGPEPSLPAISSQSSGTDETLDQLQDQWLEYCFSFDETNSDQILSQAFAQYPVHTVCAELILPGLKKVGELWYQGEISVQQEHFTAEIASRKLQALISAAPNPVHKQIILFGNPPGEHHTIGLLMMALLLKNRGWPIIYLGGNVPREDLLSTVTGSKVDLAIMSASRLVTSAALFDTIRILAENGTPVAFSGWIFSQSENLYQQIPGLYLGTDLAEAVNAIEAFLFEPSPIDLARFQDSQHHRLINKLTAVLPQLNQLTVEKMGASNLPLVPEDILAANKDLTADITSALKLGDINLLLPNIVWTTNLLANREITKDVLYNYFSIFADTIQEILGDEAEPVFTFISKLTIQQ